MRKDFFLADLCLTITRKRVVKISDDYAAVICWFT